MRRRIHAPQYRYEAARHVPFCLILNVTQKTFANIQRVSYSAAKKNDTGTADVFRDAPLTMLTVLKSIFVKRPKNRVHKTNYCEKDDPGTGDVSDGPGQLEPVTMREGELRSLKDPLIRITGVMPFRNAVSAWALVSCVCLLTFKYTCSFTVQF